MKKEFKNEQDKLSNRYDFKSLFINIGISFLILSTISIIVFLVIYFGSYSSDPTTIRLYSMLADIFTIPSIFMLLIIGINFVSKQGAFSAISYAFKLTFYTIFNKDLRRTKLPATYREYRELKQSENKPINFSFLISTIPFLIVGIVFLILFMTSK